MFHLSRQGPRMRAGFDLGPATGDQLRAVFLEEAVQHRTTIHPGAIFDPGRQFSDENAQNGPANGVSTRPRSEEHTSELQSLLRISYAVFCLKKTKKNNK